MTSREPLESLTAATEIDSQPPDQEEKDVSDDEPPILSSSVKFPITAKERSESPEDYSLPDNLPHLRAVLRSERKGEIIVYDVVTYVLKHFIYIYPMQDSS